MNLAKKIYLLFALLFASGDVFSLPTFYSDLTISQIETWPNAPSPEYGYTVMLTSDMPNTGCANPDRFVVEGGDFHRESLSLLLAAMMANKKVRVRIVRCADRPVVDRISISNN